MSFNHTLAKVLNRGSAPTSFIQELLSWAKTAPDEIFLPNAIFDIYSKVKLELGPYTGLVHRKAVMLEVMRVLAGFESSWDWREGVDTSRLGRDTQENSEAGAWQVSYDSRKIAEELRDLLKRKGITSGLQFQQQMKFDHSLAMEYVARLMRHNTKHNGPLYKDDERIAIRRSLRGVEHSIYPWLSKAAVSEFEQNLS